MTMIKCPKCGKEQEESTKCAACGFVFTVEEQTESNEAENPMENVPESEGEEVYNTSEPDTAEEGDVPDPAAPVQEPQVAPLEKKSHKKLLIAVGAGIVVLVVILLLVVNSDPWKYSTAEKKMEKKEYTAAAEAFRKLGDYKDSEKKYKEAEHLVKVSKDKTAPVLNNVPDKAKCKAGDAFDEAGWLSESGITASDDVSGEVDCAVNTDGVDTTVPGNYEIVVSAVDEAGNKAEQKLTLNVWREYTQEEIEAAVNSVFTKPIPGLNRIEYDQGNKTAWVYILNDGMANSLVASKVYGKMDKWNELTGQLDKICSTIYQSLKVGAYSDIEAVSLVLLNDKNPENLLYVSINGVKMSDAGSN